MIPLSNTPSQDHHHLLKKPKHPPDNNNNFPPPSSSSSSISSFFSLQPLSCLILSLVTLQLFLLTFFQSHPTTLPPDSNPTHLSNPDSQTCEFGKFYMYEMPPSFNVDLVKNCDNLSPWGSRCGVLSNNGFGLQATGIDHIIPKDLLSSWYSTDQFSNEVLFHNRLIHHKCRTNDVNKATAFYIPWYAGLAVGRYLWSGYSTQQRDEDCRMLIKWCQLQVPYNRSHGSDHFLVMGRITWDFRRKTDEQNDWGSRCIFEPGMQNITRLLIERQEDHYDIGVPYPTGFHPSTPSDVVSWQNFVMSRERKKLFCFAGGTRSYIKNDFRGLLLSQCRDSGESCRVVDCPSGSKCANTTSEVLSTFLDSEFCLQPRGDSFTRRSVFDCMLAGSIPVFFWKKTAYTQYQWYLPDEPASYSVFIHKDEVINGTSIKSVLEKFSKAEVKRMREKVVGIIPKIIYAKPNEGLKGIKDAVDVAVDGVLKRIKEQKENGDRW